MFGLDVDTLRQIRETFAQFPRIEKVLIYGSRAKGNYRKGSDIDITLIGKGLTLQNSIYPLMEQLDDRYLPYKFDISIFKDLDNPEFVEHILRVGKVFYRKECGLLGCNVTCIGEICEILDRARKPITKKDRVIGPHPYYGATGVLDYVEGYLFDEPLILVGEDGAKWGSGENSAFAINGKCWVNNHAHVLRPNRKRVLDTWLIYYLNYSDLTLFTTGLTVPKLNQNKLKQILIPIPHLSEQKRIVAILDEAFAAIETAIANTKQNLANVRELFESELNRAFYIPESANDCGRIATEIWQKVALAEVCLIRPPKKEAKQKLNSQDMVSFVPMNALGIRKKDLGSDQVKPFNKVYNNYTYFSDEDVLLAKITPYFQNGKLGIASGLKNGVGFGSSEFFVFRCSDQIDKEFLFYFLSRKKFTEEGVARMSGAVGQQRVPLEFIQHYPIPLPPISKQKQIVEFLDKLSEKSQSLVSHCHTKIIALTELKQSLLHQAFTGELTDTCLLNR